jgi:hypothetical protein
MEDLKPLFDSLTQAGPYAIAMVFAFVWWLERGERKQITKDFLKATNRQTNAIRTLRYVFLHGRAPAPEEYEAEDVD